MGAMLVVASFHRIPVSDQGVGELWVVDRLASSARHHNILPFNTRGALQFASSYQSDELVQLRVPCLRM